MDAALRDERDTQRAQALIQREREKDARRKLAEQQRQERETKRQARSQRRVLCSASSSCRRCEREQYADAVRVLNRGGGVRPFTTTGPGSKHCMAGEYHTLPSTVRSSAGG